MQIEDCDGDTINVTVSWAFGPPFIVVEVAQDGDNTCVRLDSLQTVELIKTLQAELTRMTNTEAAGGCA